jgi:hypothetical protein
MYSKKPVCFVSISNDHQIQTDIETMRGLSKRVRKKICNDDYESKDVMDILEYIHYRVTDEKV